MAEWHESRLWAGRDKERFEDCDCTEAACGYVTPTRSCPQHSILAGKSIRRAHPADRCGGAEHLVAEEPTLSGITAVRTER